MCYEMTSHTWLRYKKDYSSDILFAYRKCLSTMCLGVCTGSKGKSPLSFLKMNSKF